MPTILGHAGPAIPDTTHVPLPRGPVGGTHTLDRKPRRSTSPFAGRPIIEFTPDQLARAGYRTPGTGSNPTKKTTRTTTTAGRDPRHLTDHDRATITRAYQAGHTITSIARDTGHDTKTIRRALDDAGIERDTRRRAGNLTTTQIDQALTLRREGHTIDHIAATLNAPAVTITKALRPHGLAGTRVRPTRFDRDQAVTDYLAGATLAEVATRHGVCEASVRNAVRAAGHATRKAGRTRRWIDPDETARIVTLYTDQQLTIPAIAEQLGRGTRTIRERLKGAGVTLRDDRATHSGGPRRTPDSVLQAAARLYADGLTRQQVADRLGIGVRTVDTALRHTGTPTRPAAHIPGAHTGNDGAADLKALLHANGITSTQVRAWARDTGRPCPTHGIPPRALVEDYLLAHATSRGAA